jgi:hypothetical protein
MLPQYLVILWQCHIFLSRTVFSEVIPIAKLRAGQWFARMRQTYPNNERLLWVFDLNCAIYSCGEACGIFAFSVRARFCVLPAVPRCWSWRRCTRRLATEMPSSLIVGSSASCLHWRSACPRTTITIHIYPLHTLLRKFSRKSGDLRQCDE